jgi:hypothetical protein
MHNTARSSGAGEKEVGARARAPLLPFPQRGQRDGGERWVLASEIRSGEMCGGLWNERTVLTREEKEKNRWLTGGLHMSERRKGSKIRAIAGVGWKIVPKK